MGPFLLFACHTLQVRASVQKGITEMAKHNLEQEQLIAEVKNHIAIVRLAHICRQQAKFAYREECLLSHDSLDVSSDEWNHYTCQMQSQIVHICGIYFVDDLLQGYCWFYQVGTWCLTFLCLKHVIILLQIF